ncbi:MAG TPA: hypothetical protein VHS03_15880 [Gaiellaceae bacterium]|jgi:hypothetical protein|nr:hypothetical protein [Gaiellaceae bacterium]
MRAAVLLVVVAAALGGFTSGVASGTSCTRATASAAIRATKPHAPSLAGGSVVVTPNEVDGLICVDFTRDGRTDLAFTVASGGTAGDLAWVALARTASGWRVVHAQGGYKLGLYRVGTDLVDSQPVYEKKDPNCCPTGGFDHTRWHWNGTRLVLVRSYHTSS